MELNHKKNCKCGMCKAIRGETKNENNPNYGHLKYNISKDFLIEEYTRNLKSTHQIAKMIGCSAMTVHKRLAKYNIPRRNAKESNFWTGKKRPEHSKLMTLKYNKPHLCHTYIDGRSLKDNFCKCGNKISWTAKKSQKCHGDYLKTYFKGRKTNPPKKYGYKNIWMRSSWETAYAKYLDKLGIEWKYESKVFDLGNKGYIPDFYLPKTNTYIEIKGYWRKDAKEKFNLFQRLYPDIKMQLLMKHELQNMGVLI